MVDQICDTMTKSTQSICEYASWCGKTIRRITKDILPHTPAYIVTRTLNAAPYAAAATSAYLFLPLSVSIIAAVAYVVLHTLHPAPFAETTYRDMYTGLAMMHVVLILKSAYEFALTGSKIPVILAVASTAAGWWMIHKANTAMPSIRCVKEPLLHRELFESKNANKV
jgi:hypothetical protein